MIRTPDRRGDTAQSCPVCSHRNSAPSIPFCYRAFAMGRTTKWFGMSLGLITVTAFVGRVIYIITVTSREALLVFGQPGGLRLGRTADEYYYRALAISIASGNGFTSPAFGSNAPDAVHPPLTGIILAPLARFFANNDVVMRLPVAMAGAAVVLVSGLLAARLRGPRAGLLTATVAAAYPNLWMHDGLLMSETFSALATITAIYFTYRMMETKRFRDAIALGVVCGLAALTRAELLLLLPLLTAPALRFKIPAGRRLRLGGVVAIVTLTIMAPVVAYNMSRFEEPVFISYGDGPTLAGANCGPAYDGHMLGYWDGVCPFLDHAKEPSVEAARQRRHGIDYMTNHLDRLPIVVLARVGRVWGIYRTIEMLKEWQLEGKPLLASYFGLAMYVALAILAVYGVALLRRKGVPVFPLLMPMLIVTVMAAAFYGLLRNRVPGEVCLVVLGGIAIDALVSRCGGIVSEEPTPVGA